MSEESPRISVSFSVSGDDFDAEQLTNILQIKPTQIWSQKIPELRERDEFPNFAWDYAIKRRENWSLDEAILQVVDLFWEKHKALSDFTHKNSLKVTVSCYVYNEVADPEYTIALTTLKKMVDLEADFGMHLSE